MIEKRLKELYNRAYEKGYACFTDFLNMDGQSTLAGSYLPCVKFGGYDGAERIVAGFGDGISPQDFPIALLEISPASQRFADKLGHRDFLGALMNTGIKREMLGDIIISDNVGYLFCLEQIKDYIIDNLQRINHTTVTVREVDALPQGAVNLPQEAQLIVPSLRLDAIISAVFKLSRSESARLFLQDKVFVNSRAVSNSSYQVKENDIISVRGFGRLYYIETLRSTKKDRLVIRIKK